MGYFSFLYESSAFVQFVSGVSASSDMTRYAKTARHGFIGMFVVYQQVIHDRFDRDFSGCLFPLKQIPFVALQ